MQVSGTNGATQTHQTPSSSNNSGFTSADFMKLLTTELQNQDPTSPLDPTQFASQLTQYNSLDALLGIRQDLDAQNKALNLTGTGTATGSSNPVSA